MRTSDSIETLVTGYGLIEGPRVDQENRLFFSDVVRGGVYRRSPGGEIETIVPRRRGVGGIALHDAGGVVISGRNVCHVRGEETRVVFAPDGVAGFNDLFVDEQGAVLAGSMHFDPFSPEAAKDPGELYRIGPGTEPTLLYEDVSMCNGIGFSPDGQLLYHNDSLRNEVLVHDFSGDGLCRGRRVFAKATRGTPDGLGVDEQGCVWIAEHGGGCVTRFTSAGVLDRQIEVPARVVTSLCFGGPDRRDLYVVSADNTDDPALGGSIFRTRVDVPGLPVALARV